MSDPASDETDLRHAVVLDYLAHGRSGSGRSGFDNAPAGFVMAVDTFELYEVSFDEDERVTVGSTVVLKPREERTAIENTRPTTYDDLSSGARSELEYVVADLVDSEESRFVDFYNDAQPITLRLHQLNLLPGIGKKLRNRILDERKRKPFESFEELSERVPGLHDPDEIVVNRLLEELRDEDLKYKTFVGAA